MSSFRTSFWRGTLLKSSNFRLEPDNGDVHNLRVDKLSGPVLRKLKSLAQHLTPVVFVGKKGLTEELMANLNDALERREIVKVKFSSLKEQKKQLVAELIERTGSALISRVGNVAVLFRRNPNPEQQVIVLPD